MGDDSSVEVKGKIELPSIGEEQREILAHEVL